MSGLVELAPSGDGLLRAEGLSKRFTVHRGLFGGTRGVVHAVEGASLAVARGRTLALVGESGSGKSTLGRMLLGLLRPTSGRVCFDGQDLGTLAPDALRALRRRMQMIFQDPYSALNPRMRIADAIAEPLAIHRPELGPAERTRRVQELLLRVGLREEHARRYPIEFSGGQRQRIVIARALAADPELIVADEPVSALDVSVRAQILNLLGDLRRERRLTLVFISHALEVVEHVADEVAVMYLGHIVELAPAADLFERPGHPYTQALLSAVLDPRPGRKKKDRILLEGDPPSPISPPSGCTFHTRCPLHKTLGAADQARCKAEPPALRVLDTPERRVACHFVE